MVGGVLVERTVKEVLPALVGNRLVLSHFHISFHHYNFLIETKWANSSRVLRNSSLRRVKR